MLSVADNQGIAARQIDTQTFLRAKPKDLVGHLDALFLMADIEHALEAPSLHEGSIELGKLLGALAFFKDIQRSALFVCKSRPEIKPASLFGLKQHAQP